MAVRVAAPQPPYYTRDFCLEQADWFETKGYPQRAQCWLRLANFAGLNGGRVYEVELA